HRTALVNPCAVPLEHALAEARFVKAAVIHVENESAVRPKHARHFGEHRDVAGGVEVAEALPHADHGVHRGVRKRNAKHVATHKYGMRRTRHCISERGSVAIQTDDPIACVRQWPAMSPGTAAE